jgi:CheY-like chemotaxis protein
MFCEKNPRRSARRQFARRRVKRSHCATRDREASILVGSLWSVACTVRRDEGGSGVGNGLPVHEGRAVSATLANIVFRFAPRVLVIDDDSIVAASTGRVLRMYDIDVETDPRVAVARILAGEQFAVVICDLNMPSMSGREVVAEILAHYAGRDDCPAILVVSGSDELLDGDPLAGVEVLRKPCGATELRTVVSSLIADRRSR